jgi:hypothetical protein
LSNQKQSESVESVRSVWTRTLRNEVLRVGKRLARVGAVGVWLATFGNADGSRCFPGRDKLAGLTGFSEESVSRCLQVLEAAGMISGKRRPNNNAEYQLMVPTSRPDWDAVLHIVENTRQKHARALQKLREVEARTASGDAIRTASPAGVPDSVPGGGSGPRPRTPSEIPDSVRGHPRTASPDANRTASPAGGTQTPTYGRYPLTHPEAADLSPQPQVRVGARGENDLSPGASEPTGETGADRRCACGHRIVRPDRDRCGGCIKDDRSAAEQEAQRLQRAEQLQRDIAAANEVLGGERPGRPLVPVPGQGRPQQDRPPRPLTMTAIDGGRAAEDQAQAAPPVVRQQQRAVGDSCEP